MIFTTKNSITINNRYFERRSTNASVALPI
ncbi:Uncharacterised protein [Vibrio cholerae]|nr:Uncharacterised protein [Vibrio cholerae]